MPARDDTRRRAGRRLPLAAYAIATAVVFGAAATRAEQPHVEAAVPAEPPKATHQVRKLNGNSTLAEWRSATPAARSRIAVALAKTHLAPDAAKLEVATVAMEITGCLSKTASDPKFDNWRVATTAGTCLTAPEKK